MIKILITLLLFLIAGCGTDSNPISRVLSAEEVIDINGVVYQLDHYSPLNGRVLIKYKNGNKMKNIAYKNGKRHGLFVLWHMSGQKIMEV